VMLGYLLHVALEDAGIYESSSIQSSRSRQSRPRRQWEVLAACRRRPAPSSALGRHVVVGCCVELDAVRRATGSPAHRAHGEDRVGREEVLLLARDEGVLDEVDVLAALGRVVLAR
jgi:hypothetical protein